MMYKSGLVLEGGGMRGIHTAGVLDFFMDKGIEFESCYGVSAGACHACSYLSGQRGRALKVCVDFLDDKRYCSIYSLITTGDIFGVKLNYDIIPNKLVPYDYDAFAKSKTKFYAVLTSLDSGLAEYHRITDLRRDMDRIQASSSLPLVSRNVKVDGKLYLDGGIADSIPVKRAFDDGNEKNVVILTQHEGYRKQKNSMMPAIRLRYLTHQKFADSCAKRHIVYNDTLDYIERERQAGRLFVIRPKEPITIGRLETDRDKINDLYLRGYHLAEELYGDLKEFLEK